MEFLLNFLKWVAQRLPTTPIGSLRKYGALKRFPHLYRHYYLKMEKKLNVETIDEEYHCFQQLE